MITPGLWYHQILLMYFNLFTGPKATLMGSSAPYTSELPLTSSDI